MYWPHEHLSLHFSFLCAQAKQLVAQCEHTMAVCYDQLGDNAEFKREVDEATRDRVKAEWDGYQTKLATFRDLEERMKNMRASQYTGPKH